MKGRQILSYEVLESCPKDICLKITFNCDGMGEKVRNAELYKKDDAECSFEGKFAKGNDGKEIHLTVFEDCPRKTDSILEVSKARCPPAKPMAPLAGVLLGVLIS